MDIEQDFDDIMDQFINPVRVAKVKDIFFKQQSKSDKDEQFQQGLIEYRNQESIGHNLNLKEFNNKQNYGLSKQDIKILASQTDRGILNSSLEERQEALRVKLKIFEKLIDEAEAEEIEIQVGSVVFEGNKYLKQSSLYLSTLKQTKMINLERLDNYIIYPGQIIAAQCLKDSYNKGKELQIEKLHQFKYDQYEIDDNVEFDEGNVKNALGIIVAAGPFTQSDSLKYDPLLSLIEIIQNRQVCCDILILLGPILDEQNEKIADSNIDYDEIFAKIIHLLNQELPDIEILIVNSTSEINSIHPIPQPEQIYPTNIKFLGNPSKIILKEQINMAIINADVVSDLMRQARYKNQNKKQLEIEEALNEIKNQRTFIPCFPSSFSVDQTYMNQDLNLIWDKTNFQNNQDNYIDNYATLMRELQMPDIFICSSKQLEFVKPIDNCLFICPTIITEEGKYVHIILNLNTGCQPIKTMRAEIKTI